MRELPEEIKDAIIKRCYFSLRRKLTPSIKRTRKPRIIVIKGLGAFHTGGRKDIIAALNYNIKIVGRLRPAIKKAIRKKKEENHNYLL